MVATQLKDKKRVVPGASHSYQNDVPRTSLLGTVLSGNSNFGRHIFLSELHFFLRKTSNLYLIFGSNLNFLANSVSVECSGGYARETWTTHFCPLGFWPNVTPSIFSSAQKSYMKTQISFVYDPHRLTCNFFVLNYLICNQKIKSLHSGSFPLLFLPTCRVYSALIHVYVPFS